MKTWFGNHCLELMTFSPSDVPKKIYLALRIHAILHPHLATCIHRVSSVSSDDAPPSGCPALRMPKTPSRPSRCHLRHSWSSAPQRWQEWAPVRHTRRDRRQGRWEQRVVEVQRGQRRPSQHRRVHPSPVNGVKREDVSDKNATKLIRQCIPVEEPCMPSVLTSTSPAQYLDFHQNEIMDDLVEV